MNNKRKLTIQSLQNRQLMAADFSMGGIDTISDAAEVSRFAGQTSGSPRVIAAVKGVSGFTGATSRFGCSCEFRATHVDSVMLAMSDSKLGSRLSGLVGDDIGVPR
ncbi:MAG: hypothetical protein WBD20_02445 [Pirellulaceae bacterium]